jgi:hypothetical protein
MNQNQMLNKKRNNEEDYSRDDEWKGNIFEDSTAHYKSSQQRQDMIKKSFQEQKDARDVYRNDFHDRRELDYKEYDNNINQNINTRRYRQPGNEAYFQDQRRPRNFHSNTFARTNNYEPKSNYHSHKRSEYYNRRNDYNQNHTRPYIRNKSHSIESLNSEDDKSEKKKNIVTKNFNFLIALPKNYKRIIEDNFDFITKEVGTILF